MLLENVGQLVFWLVILVVTLNIVFLFFLVRRRIIRKRFFQMKDAARERYRDAVEAFALGQATGPHIMESFRDARSPAEREVLSELLFAAATLQNSQRISDVLYQIGFIERWSRQAFGRATTKELLGVFEGKKVEKKTKQWSAALRPLNRTRIMAVGRSQAVHNLARLYPKYAAVFLAAALGDPAPQVRRAAVEGMGKARDPELAPLMVEELRLAINEGSDVSLRSLKAALVRFRLEDVEAFLPYLSDKHPRCRFFVVDALRQICDKAALKSRLTKNDFSPALYRALLQQCQFDEFADVRARSSYIVRYFRDQNAVDMLRNLMKDKNEFVRLHSVRAAADRYYVDLLPDVVARLTDERWLVREAAVQTLRAMGSKGRDALFQFFIACDDKFAAEQACDEFQRRGVIPELLESMAAGGNDGLMAENVARKIAAMGKTSLLVSQITSSDSFAVQVALLDTLAINPSNEFVSVLNMLSQEDSGQIASKARQVLSRIESGSNLRFGSEVKRKEQSSGA
ncbi:MAG TPA: HEAT repeat domain-containing protein [Candidatus Koribacter sp.]|jgi:hypothetical protein